MAYDRAILSYVLRQMEQRRTDNAAQAESRLYLVEQHIPRIRDINRRLRATSIRALRISFESENDAEIDAQIAALREENIRLQAEKRELLAAHGYPANYLEPIVTCPRCNDTGYVGKNLCSCVQKQIAEEQARRLTTILPLQEENFDTFSFEYYDTAWNATLKSSPRDYMKGIYDHCRRYAREFGLHHDNLLLVGSTGVGKTFLSSCIAREVSEAGFSVAYESAVTIFSNFDAVRFRPQSSEDAAEAVDKYRGADLLIIDDLGMEHPTPMTRSYLYELVNSRLREKKCTIISTNLPPANLEITYNAAIASRLIGDYTQISFPGGDIRRTKAARRRMEQR